VKHYQIPSPNSLKTLRKNAPLSEEDLKCNSFHIVAETMECIRKLLSIELFPPIEKTKQTHRQSVLIIFKNANSYFNTIALLKYTVCLFCDPSLLAWM